MRIEVDMVSKNPLFFAQYGDAEQLSKSLVDEDHEVRIAALSNCLADKVIFKTALNDIDVRVRKATEALLKVFK
jgi:hypothetical protein